MRKWSQNDFDEMTWHDMHCYGFMVDSFGIECGTCDLIIRGDYIIKWMCNDDKSARFMVAPVNLIFKEISGLRINIDYEHIKAGMCPFSISGINRAKTDFGYEYRIDLNWPTGYFQFSGDEYTQEQIGQELESDKQCLFRL